LSGKHYQAQKIPGREKASATGKGGGMATAAERFPLLKPAVASEKEATSGGPREEKSIFVVVKASSISSDFPRILRKRGVPTSQGWAATDPTDGTCQPHGKKASRKQLSEKKRKIQGIQTNEHHPEITSVTTKSSRSYQQLGEKAPGEKKFHRKALTRTTGRDCSSESSSLLQKPEGPSTRKRAPITEEKKSTRGE